MKNRTLRACQMCGKPFWGTTDSHYCPECAKIKKLDTVVKIRNCQDCGTKFYGGPRAKRCPSCTSLAKNHYKKSPTMRPLGSIDKCVICGKEYTVTSGRQKYCSQLCQHKGVLAWQREHKKDYNKISGQDIKKQIRRESAEKVCVYCLRRFKSNTASNLCSDYCRQEQRKLNQCKADLKRGYKRDYDSYINKRDKYRQEVMSNDL